MRIRSSRHIRGWAADAPPLTMVIHAETLRLWPPSCMVTRRILESVILDRRTMQVETMCLSSPGSLQRDPDGLSPTVPAKRWLRLARLVKAAARQLSPR